MSMFKATEQLPPKYEAFMAYHNVSGEMFVNFWVNSPVNNFFNDDRPFTHWQIIANDNSILNNRR